MIKVLTTCPLMCSYFDISVPETCIILIYKRSIEHIKSICNGVLWWNFHRVSAAARAVHACTEVTP